MKRAKIAILGMKKSDKKQGKALKQGEKYRLDMEDVRGRKTFCLLQFVTVFFYCIFVGVLSQEES